MGIGLISAGGVMSDLSILPQDDNSSSHPLQFDYVAPTAAGTTAPHCVMCAKTLDLEYHEMNGQTLCGECRLQVEAQYRASKSPATMTKALLFALGAALLGAIIYWGFMKITHIELGLMAIAVGWLVGQAIRKATAGWGGRRYQVLAVACTYAAITFSYVPFYLEEVDQQEQTTAAPDGKSSGSSLAAPPPAKRSPPRSIWAVLAILVLLILGAPFMGGITNILGIIIIFLGLRQAWVLSRGTTLVTSGPYALSANSTL